jgi:hypothetical protein
MRRWLLVLALAAGCGGSAGRAPDADASSDTGPDGHDGNAGKADTTTAPDVAGDRQADVNDDRSDAASGTDALDAIDAIDARADADAKPVDAPQPFCPAQIPTVTLASGTVSGVLKGAGANPAVSCRGGLTTLGPEAFFTLTLDQPTTLELVVTAPIDTAIAIRPGACADAISEIACGEDPPTSVGDAGLPPTPTDDAGIPLRQTQLRAPLAAGTYTIVVDSYTLGGLPSAAYTLSVGHLQPRANGLCATPTLLASSGTLPGEPLDLAGAPRSVCGGGTQSSLYYTVGVPSGQRLTVRATPHGGDRTWMPRIEAFTACSSNTCLAQGHLAAGTSQQLDWINNGPNWQLVYLAVGADGAVSGATFDLSATVIDLLATCNRPITIKDGTNLSSQDLSLATLAMPTCNGTSDHAFYYVATLLPQQSISVQAAPTPGSNIFNVPIVSVRQDCDTASCSSNGSGAAFTNQSNADATVLIEVTPRQAGVLGLFDLSVSMPPPPASIAVTPTTGLVTTESGGKATFTVALGSPPTSLVSIGVASDTPTEGTANPTTLQFTTDNWKTPQTVTVTGVDDTAADGPRDYKIVTSPAVSADGRYMDLDPADVEATNLDNEPGVAFSGASDVVTSESGMATTFQVSLNAAPTANVTLGFSSSDVGEGAVSPAQVTFTTTNWNTPQAVTVTGVDDAVADGTQAYTIVTGALTSADVRYGGQNPPDLSAHNLDDDQVAVGVKVLSGDHACQTVGGTVPMAMDRAGTLFIAMPCDNALWLTTSTDGGVTFTTPAVIPGTEIFNGSAMLAAGAPGFAYVTFGGNDGSVQFVRTPDGGATWSTPVVVSPRQDFSHLAAGEKSVVILTPGPDGTTKTQLSRSLDGGKSFVAPSLVDGTSLDIAMEPDGQTTWLIDIEGNTPVFKSTDAGATFKRIVELNQDASSHLFGNATLFTFPGPLELISLADPTNVEQSAITFLDLPPFSMAADDLDGLTILDGDPQGHLRATHVVPRATPPAAGRTLAPGPSGAGAVALSRKASAVAFVNGSILLYTTVVW